MYIANKCQCPDWNETAITTIDEFDNIISGPGFCLKHTKDPIKARIKLLNYIQNHDTITGVSFSGMNVSNLDLSHKRFYGCNFRHCNFANIHSDGLRVKISFLDFSTFSECDMINSHIQFCSFSGSRFVHVIFTGSDLIHNNFNGTTLYQSSFDKSDLYNSSFIKSILINTSMTDCNLKKTVFYESIRDKVSFRLSNTREAYVIRGNDMTSLDDLDKDPEGAL